MSLDKLLSYVVLDPLVVTQAHANTKNVSWSWDKKMPTGDQLIKALNILIEGTLTVAESAAGTVQDVAKMVPTIRFQSNLLKDIVQAQDLYGLRKYVEQLQRQASLVTQVTTGNGSKSFMLHVRIPFDQADVLRPMDTSIDALLDSFTLSMDFAPATALISGGTYTNLTYTATVTPSFEVINGPLDIAKYGPSFAPLYRRQEWKNEAGEKQLELSTGDTIYHSGLLMQQRDGADVSNIITDLGIKIGRDSLRELMPVNALRGLEVQSLRLPYTLGTGHIPMRFNHSGSYNDMLPLIDAEAKARGYLHSKNVATSGDEKIVLYSFAAAKLADKARRKA